VNREFPSVSDFEQEPNQPLTRHTTEEQQKQAGPRGEDELQAAN